MLSLVFFVMLGFLFAENVFYCYAEYLYATCRYAEFRYTVWRYAEYCYAECRGAV